MTATTQTVRQIGLDQPSSDSGQSGEAGATAWDGVELKLFAKMLKHDVPDERGDEPDCEIRAGKDVVQGRREGLPAPIGNGEFAHQ